MKVLIKEQLSEHKSETPEGYLICVDAILARTGKQTYTRDEVFGDGSQDLIEVDRDPKEVFDATTLASFENKPVTIEHPDVNVDVNNIKDYAVGFVRDVRKGNIDGQDVILGNLIIEDKDAINLIKNGEYTELSCGYNCEIEDEANPKQTKIRGNHVALCQSGRAGIARIQDSENSKIDDARYFQEDIEQRNKMLKEILTKMNQVISRKYDLGEAYESVSQFDWFNNFIWITFDSSKNPHPYDDGKYDRALMSELIAVTKQIANKYNKIFKKINIGTDGKIYHDSTPHLSHNTDIGLIKIDIYPERVIMDSKINDAFNPDAITTTQCVRQEEPLIFLQSTASNAYFYVIGRHYAKKEGMMNYTGYDLHGQDPFEFARYLIKSGNWKKCTSNDVKKWVRPIVDSRPYTESKIEDAFAFPEVDSELDDDEFVEPEVADTEEICEDVDVELEDLNSFDVNMLYNKLQDAEIYIDKNQKELLGSYTLDECRKMLEYIKEFKNTHGIDQYDAQVQLDSMLKRKGIKHDVGWIKDSNTVMTKDKKILNLIKAAIK